MNSHEPNMIDTYHNQSMSENQFVFYLLFFAIYIFVKFFLLVVDLVKVFIGELKMRDK